MESLRQKMKIMAKKERTLEERMLTEETVALEMEPLRQKMKDMAQESVNIVTGEDKYKKYKQIQYLKNDLEYLVLELEYLQDKYSNLEEDYFEQ